MGRRHQLYGNALDNRQQKPLEDTIAEADEMFQNAGKNGIREVHCNTMEGIWTGLRNFLRPF